jgi:hypothetical protein
MEMANTYLASESFALAVAPLQQITSSVSLAAWHPAAYLKLGVAYFNIDKRMYTKKNTIEEILFMKDLQKKLIKFIPYE